MNRPAFVFRRKINGAFEKTEIFFLFSNKTLRDESTLFLEAIRQFINEVGRENALV